MTIENTSSHTPRWPQAARTSEVIREYLAKYDEERISLGQLRDALGDRVYGILLFLFALPNLAPVAIPGVSAVLGIPLVLLALQLTYGRKTPWFPSWLANRSFAREDFINVFERARPWLARVERLLRPRFPIVLAWTGERLIAALCLVVAIVLTFPIPLGNWLPALALAIIGLAIVAKDGAAAIVGVLVGIVSLIIAGGVVFAMAKAFMAFLHRLLA